MVFSSIMIPARKQRILRQHVETDRLLGVEAVPVGPAPVVQPNMEGVAAVGVSAAPSVATPAAPPPAPPGSPLFPPPAAGSPYPRLDRRTFSQGLGLAYDLPWGGSKFELRYKHLKFRDAYVLANNYNADQAYALFNFKF